MKNLINKIDWEKSDGLVPAIIQDANTNQVLMLGYMNKRSLEKTLTSKKVWFFSRARKRLWMKGEVSRNTLELVDVKTDCDSDTLLIKAIPKGPTCHSGQVSCFGNRDSLNILIELYKVILDRKANMPESSYTTLLFSEGVDKICEKIEEESTEVIQAAKKETKKRLTEESCDLIYHLLVLLVEKGIGFDEIFGELKGRRK